MATICFARQPHLCKALNQAMESDSDLNLPAYELLLALEEAGEDGLRMTGLAVHFIELLPIIGRFYPHSLFC